MRWHTLACGVFLALFTIACDQPKPPLVERDAGAPASSATMDATADLALQPAPDLASTAAAEPDALEGLTMPVIAGSSSCEAWLDTHGSKLVEVPQRYAKLVPRISYPAMHRARGLIHEGHNVVMRGEGRSGGVFEDGGDQIAGRWRELSCGMGGLFVLRDSLFSQQDHALANDPFALMLPPNWVTRAAWLVHEGEPIVNVADFALDDDASWRGATQEEIFGSFLASSSLRDGVKGRTSGGSEVERLRALHGRRALGQLHAHVEALRRAAPHGWRAVSRAGAERIAWSDRAYFGEALRRDVIIPILVEHPNAHELEEGKGVLWEGGEQEVSAEVVQAVTQDIYRARLRDGALAVERYDLSQPGDRQRAISLLEALIPSGEPDLPATSLWLWVNGPLDPQRKLQGESALAYMETFERELEGARIDRARLRLLGKPTYRVERGLDVAKKRAAYAGAIQEQEAAGLDVLSVSESATSLGALFR